MFRRTPEAVIVRRPSYVRMALWWVVRKLSWLAWKIAGGLLRAKFQLVCAVLGAWLAGLRGGRRHIVRPLSLVAFAWVPFPNDTWTYAGTAAVLWTIYGAKGRVRGWSRPELSILATGASFLTVWHPLMAAFGGLALEPHAYVLGAAYVAAMGYHAGLWIWGRRIRPTEAEQVDPLILEWATKVAIVPGVTPVVPSDPDDPNSEGVYAPTELGADAEGVFTEWNSTGGEEGSGILRLANAKASDVAKLDEDAERALDLRRGGVVISADPRLSVREVRVFIVKDPNAAAERMVYFDGLTMEEDGRFVIARRRDGSPVYGRHRDPSTGSATHAGYIAPSTGGKGAAFRIHAIHASADPLTCRVNIDGKGGAGIPYLRHGAAHHATKPHLFLPTLEAYLAAMMVRSDLEGDRGHDGWVASEEAPQVDLWMDELGKIHGQGTRKEQARAKWIILTVSQTGRSLGYAMRTTKQKGDDPSWGNTETRMNVMGPAGWVWLGKVSDTTAKNVAFQSLTREFGIDPVNLPDGPGWAYIVGGALRGQAVLESRTLFLPTRSDVDRKKLPAPCGAFEDWNERHGIQTAWHPLEWQAFTTTYDRLAEAAEAAKAKHDSAGAGATAPPAGTTVATGGPAVADVPFDTDEPGGGIADPWAVPIGSAARLATVTPIRTAPAPAPKMPAGRLKVLTALTEAKESGEGRVSMRELARRTGLHVSTVKEHLDKLAADELADGTDEGWSAA